MGLVIPKFIVIDGTAPMRTQFEYKIGEVVVVNSTGRAKCVDKKEVDGRLFQYFKTGRCVWIYD